MLLELAKQILQKKETLSPDFVRMMQYEFKSVPIEYAQQFLNKNKRLPTMDELHELA